MTYAAFRSAVATPAAATGKPAKGSVAKAGTASSACIASTTSGDVEDLFTPDEYVSWFNATFSAELAGKHADVLTLPAGDRIIQRLELWLSVEGIALRPSGGFNHYRVANHLASNPPASFSEETLHSFESTFASINKRFTA